MSKTGSLRRTWSAAAVAAVLVGAGGVVVLEAAEPGDAAKTLARQVLNATGVKGGLIVHVGCGDGRLTAALRAGDGFLVHALESDAAAVEQAREYLQSLGLYGKVAVEQRQGKRLPYVDNLVNLVVMEQAGQASREEIMRVLAPGGVAYVKAEGRWTKTVKPRPPQIDQWTHYLHDPSNNAVAHDELVGPPRHFQWIGSPPWSRHHDRMSSISAMVCTGDRTFYIFDEGPTSSIMLPSQWSLVARDAFNGTILWKRPIPSWHPHLYPFKSGPTQLTRRLVAVGDRVYVTLGREAPLSILDAATGQTVRTCEGTQATEEILVSDGVALVLVNRAPTDWNKFRPESNNIGEEKARVARDWPWDEKPRQVMALRADTGAVLWTKDAPVAPMTLAADGRGVYYHDGRQIICLDRASGRARWQSEPVSRLGSIPTCFGPTLVVYGDVVLFAGGDRSMTALSSADGKKLWTAPHQPGGHNSPEDLLVVGGLAWSGAVAATKDSGIFTGRDLLTGAIKNEFPPDTGIYFMHHRCYRSKATDKYLIPSRTGIEFVDPAAKHWDCNHWVRSGCIYGIMPCNGMVYTTPHDCACYMEAKLNGFCALAPESASRKGPATVSDEDRLQRGPAYEEAQRHKGTKAQSDDDWPTYRHDAGRSGRSDTALSAEIRPDWQAEPGGRLSSPVIAEDKLFVAAIDTQAIHALDAASGRRLWRYTAGGRVDSPPTIWQGRVLFGSADGWIYCLRAADGKLAWRFRATPEERRLVAFEQVESVWPVHGSVLVQDGIVYAVAGRSMFVDGGLRLVRLDARTGRKLAETVLDQRDPQTGENLQAHVKGLNMPVALPDVLSSDGRYVYMRSQRFDLEGNRQQLAPHSAESAAQAEVQYGENMHLFCPTGFLDDAWWHRSYWVFGKSFAQGAGGWPQAGRVAPSGRVVVFDDARVYGFGRQPEYYKWTSPVRYQLFAAGKAPKSAADAPAPQAAKAAGKKAKPKEARQQVQYQWAQALPLQVRAMVLARKILFVAGPPELVDEEEAFAHPDDPKIQAKLQQQAAALQGKMGTLLWAVAAGDGAKLAEYQVASVPVFDGMAAAAGRIYLTTADGKVHCFAAK